MTISTNSMASDAESIENRLHGVRPEIDSLREVGALFYQRGWSVGTSSNYSVVLQRDPVQLLVTASGKDKGQLTRDDFVVVDDSGLPAWSNQPKSSAETLLHVACVRENPHVNAVLHTHSTWGTLLSDLYFEQGFLSIEGYEMLKGLSGIATHETDYRLLIVENTQDIPVLAEQLSRRWRDDPRSLAHGYLIRRHGLYTWGRDVDEARRHIEIFEFLFEVLGRRVMLTGKC